MIYLRYFLTLPFAYLVTLLCWLTNPISCIWTVRTNGRDDLIPLFRLWQTYDNHVDEYWYGKYGNSFADWDYNNSAVKRYFYRVMWLSRNTGYGWSYLLFSIPHGTGFQWKGQTKPFLGFYNDYNIGYKSHAGFDRDDIACRLIGLRKV